MIFVRANVEEVYIANLEEEKCKLGGRKEKRQDPRQEYYRKGPRFQVKNDGKLLILSLFCQLTMHFSPIPGLCSPYSLWSAKASLLYTYEEPIYVTKLHSNFCRPSLNSLLRIYYLLTCSPALFMNFC